MILQSPTTNWAPIRLAMLSRPGQSRRTASRFKQSNRREREPVEVRVAQGRWEHSRAFELVYGVYLRQGLINKQPGKIVYRPSFGRPTSRTIVGSCGSRIIGTLTLVGDNPYGLPMEATYGREIRALRRQGRTVSEFSGLAIEPDCRRYGATAFREMTRFLVQLAILSGNDDLLFAIHPKHEVFYRRFFRVELLGPQRRHKPVNDNPAIACRIDLRKAASHICERYYHYYTDHEIPRTKLQQRGISPADHTYFCWRMGIAVTDQSIDSGLIERHAA